ncbi:MAG: ATP-binding cassette domain-containing protein [Pseudomonadota bacterium]
MPGDVLIRCRNIWKLFGADPARFLRAEGGSPSPARMKEHGYIGAVQDVSFDVHKGEILIIMGLSGSGKSTLIRCITRLNDPTAGAMEYEGRDLLKLSERELIEIRRHRFGMVFQGFGLLPHRDVLENVAFPLEVQGLAKGERVTRAKQMIDLVGLAGRESYFPRELSGGQQQRVGIARSLAVEPEIWFLDEPFSALDPLIRAEMQQEFLRLQSMLHKTIVFITHDFEEATKLADRIGIMKDGRMVQLATPEELVLNPADDYVAEFAKNAPRERIISVRAIMDPVAEGTEGAVQASAKIGAVAEQVLTADRPVAVVDDQTQQVVGSLTRQDVATAIFGRHAA